MWSEANGSLRWCGTHEVEQTNGHKVLRRS